MMTMSSFPSVPGQAPPILQFGTSRFLQAHVDLFVGEAARRHPSEALGKITVVQTTNNAASHARIAALREHGRYPVRVRGLLHQEEIDTYIECDSIAEALHADTDWQTLRERIRHDVKVIVSNTGDSGYAAFAEDHAALLGAEAAPRGFVAKLVVLLYERFRAGADPITVLPCELVSRNGDVLRGMVIDIARTWECASEFVDYLEHGCVWINSLVDRIVSAAIDPVGAIAEPYALWAIERRADMVLPCRHERIVLTDDLTQFERRKLFLLNAGHTVLAQCWLDARRVAGKTDTVDADRADSGANAGAGAREACDANPNEAAATTDRIADHTSVLEAMQRVEWRETLESVWRDEVLPVFAALGEYEIASRYLSDVRDRFNNPFLAHRVADIATHHAEKKQRRFRPVVALADELGLAIEQRYLRAALAVEDDKDRDDKP